MSQATLRLGDRRLRPLPQTPSGPVILLDPEMPRSLQLSPDEITHYRGAKLASRGVDKHGFEELNGPETQVLTPDDVFLPDCFCLPREGALVNSWLSTKIYGKPMINGTAVTPLLPLKECMRDLFSSAELSRYCSMHVVASEDGMDLLVTLLLPLEGQKEAYPIKRLYPLQKKNLIDEDLPVIALWPYISDFNWKRYVIFAEDCGTGLSVDGFADYEEHIGGEEQESVKYFSCESFPDLIKLTERKEYRGLIPVNLPPTINKTASRWRVGIDFGTSFTNFFIDEGSGPSRKPLETRVIPLTMAEYEYQINLLYKFFIPQSLLPKDGNPPTSTAINTYGWHEIRGNVPKLFHQARVQWPSTNANLLRGASIRTGFNWRQPQYLRPFLQELALLIRCNAAAVGVNSVEWALSYPNTFTPNHTRNIRREWDIICKEVADYSGLYEQYSGKDQISTFQPDALAFAGYFYNILSLQMVHATCAKIGHHSTAISIWQDNTLVHQVSVPFAGRDICTRVMQSKPSFIRFLFTPQLAGDIADNNEVKFRQDPNFNSWLDNCLRYESQELLVERMPIYRAEKNMQVLAFASLMAISFGGFYHYLGLVLKALAKEGRLRKHAPMPVYVGGYGAQFMHWLDESGFFCTGCDADLLFEELQCQSACFASTEKISATTTLSNAFNDEVACGLIINGMNLNGDFDPRDDVMFTGEELVINGQIFNALDRVILSQEMNTVESFALGSLTELKKFVTNYDDALTSLNISTLFPIRKLAANETFWNEVQTQVRAICLERFNKEISDLEPEPGFIIGLRALSNILARQWAEQF
jgi:hypothetical protein